jgi:hypothetical protein
MSYMPLSAETEAVATKVIGCAIEVHRTLGPGFLESIYERAMHLELDAQGLRFESEKPLTVASFGKLGVLLRGLSGLRGRVTRNSCAHARAGA